jgi:hypothetical protein
VEIVRAVKIKRKAKREGPKKKRFLNLIYWPVFTMLKKLNDLKL